MSEEGRNPWAARDVDATKSSDETARPDVSNDETQVLKTGGDVDEGAATEPAIPAELDDADGPLFVGPGLTTPDTADEKAPVIPDKPYTPPSMFDKPFAPPADAGEDKPAKTPDDSSHADSDVVPSLEKVPTPPVEDTKAGRVGPPIPPIPEDVLDPPPVSAQPSVESLRPKQPPRELRADALVAEDTDNRDRQIKQTRIFAIAALGLAVIALIIAFTAGGGGQDTVDTAHIADSAVTNPKLADGAVTAQKLAPGVVTQGKPGPAGPAGVRGPIGHIGKTGPAGAPGITGMQTLTKNTTTDTTPTKTLTVSCPKGKSILYGGAGLTGDTTNVALQSSGPAVGGTTSWTAEAAAITTTATTTAQTKGAATPVPTPTGDWGITVSLTCASFARASAPAANKSGKGGLKAGAGETIKPITP